MRGYSPLGFLGRGAMLLAILMLRPLQASAAPVLTGDTVSAAITQVDVCVRTPFGSPAVVGAGVEFSGQIGIGKSCSYIVMDLTVDISDSSVTVAFTGDPGLDSSGPIVTLSITGLDFTPNAIISGVTCSGRCFPDTPAMTFTDHSLNLAFFSLRNTDVYVFDLATADTTVPAPEPTSLALFGTGLAAVIVRRRGARTPDARR